jgi:hypothetical protein
VQYTSSPNVSWTSNGHVIPQELRPQILSLLDQLSKSHCISESDFPFLSIVMASPRIFYLFKKLRDESSLQGKQNC